MFNVHIENAWTGYYAILKASSLEEVEWIKAKWGNKYWYTVISAEK